MALITATRLTTRLGRRTVPSVTLRGLRPSRLDAADTLLSMTVKIKSTYLLGQDVPETEVEISAEGEVTWEGDCIGYVWKGSRTYSPPLHKGSRIVKYHKEVPEWHGGPRPRYGARHRRDTRQQVIQDLIATRLKERAS